MKDIGIQTKHDHIGPRILSKTPLPEYEFPQILYQSHTVFWLLGMMCVISYVSLSREELDSYNNKRIGIIGALLALVFYCSVHLPNSRFMSRPHPAVWRLLNGLGVAYLSMLMYLLFQNPEDARGSFALLDPALGKPLPDKNYAEDCRVYTPEHPSSNFANIMDCLFDVYIPSHALGWFFKMIIIRDIKLCWFLSIMFEFMEISLRHHLPNFYECWWDSLILDILVCNGIGIYLGYLACSFSEMKEYYWGIGEDNRCVSGTFSRAALQFTPYSWSVYKWQMFSSTKNFATTVWYIVFVNLVDLSNFYMKFVLWIPASHWILLARVLFWAIFAISCTREYYGYVQADFKIRLGNSCWLGHLLLFVEWLIIIKNSEGIFTETMPIWLQITWTGIFGLVMMIGLWLFYRDINKKIK